jgi:hypothetical protein
VEQAARVPGCIFVTFALYLLSGTISHSHGLRRDRSPFSRRVMDHRGVADRCPICVHTIRQRSAVMRFGLESYAAAVECSTGLNVGPLGSVIKCNLRVKNPSEA